MTATKTDNNEALFTEIMNDTGASYIEACVMVSYDCDTLEQTQDTIAKIVTYARLLKSLLPGAVEYMRNDRYKGENVTEAFIQSEARELVENQAWMFVYDWETQLDDYDAMTEAEINAVMFAQQRHR